MKMTYTELGQCITINSDELVLEATHTGECFYTYHLCIQYNIVCPIYMYTHNYFSFIFNMKRDARNNHVVSVLPTVTPS